VTQPWEYDDLRRRLAERMLSYERFRERGGNPQSAKGRGRRKEIAQLAGKLREGRSAR
jgi:hypothetical protein